MSTIPTEESQRKAAQRTTAALQQGELPHNAELNVMLDRASATLESTKLADDVGPESKKIATDASEVVQNLKQVIEEKNRDEDLQKLHVHVKEAVKEAAAVAQLPSGDFLATPEWKVGADAVRDLVQSIVADDGFRAALGDLGRLVRDVFFDASSTIDAATQPTSTLRAAGEQMKAFGYGPNSPFAPADTAPNISGVGTDVQGRYEPLLGEESDSDDSGFRYHYTAEENEMYRSTFLNDAPLSDLKRAQLEQRFATFFQQLHQDPSRVSAVRTIVRLMKTARDRLQPQLQEQQQVLADDPAFQHHVQQAMVDAQALLESFAMNKSLDPLINSWSSFLSQTRNDSRFEAYFEQLNTFFQRSLTDPDFVRGPNFQQDMARCIESGRSLLSNYRALLFTITDELDDFLLCLRRDQTAQRLSDSTNRLVADLFYDDNGRLVLKPSAASALRKVLVPLIADQLKFVAVPRITGSDESMDYTIDNITFRGEEALPDRIRVHNFNKLDVDMKRSADQYEASIYIAVDNIQANMQDISFWYQRKTIPKLTDQGQMDLIIDGKGINIQLWLSVSQESGHLFTPSRVRCDIQRVRVRNIRAEHKVLYRILRPIIQSRMRRALASAIEENLSRMVLVMDEKFAALANTPVISSMKEQLEAPATRVQNSEFSVEPTSETRRDY